MLVSLIPDECLKQSLLCKRWEYDSESQRFTPLPKRSRFLEKLDLPYFQGTGSLFIFESKITTGRQKNDFFPAVVFAIIVTLFLKLSIVIIIDGLFKKFARSQLILKLREERKISSKTRCVELPHNKKPNKVLSCGSASSGVST